MNVRDLIDHLECQNPDAEVVIASDYGDHCHTAQTESIEEITTGRLCESGYSSSGFAMIRRSSDDESACTAEKVILVGNDVDTCEYL